MQRYTNEHLFKLNIRLDAIIQLKNKLNFSQLRR